jgi:hypothetical protein
VGFTYEAAAKGAIYSYYGSDRLQCRFVDLDPSDTGEPSMSNHNPSKPSMNRSKEAAEKSQEAGIADEGAAYTNAIERAEEAKPKTLRPEEPQTDGTGDV